MKNRPIFVSLAIGILLGAGILLLFSPFEKIQPPKVAPSDTASALRDHYESVASEVSVDKRTNGDSRAVAIALGELRHAIRSLEERIEAIEARRTVDPLDGPTSEQNSSDYDFAAEEQDTDEQPSQERLRKHAARKAYYESLEQSIWDVPDETFTQNVTSSFEEMVASRKEWAMNASLELATCSNAHCKVVLNYDNDMDPTALFELDASVFMWDKELPKSTAYHQSLPDGTTNLVIYFARSGAQLPVLP